MMKDQKTALFEVVDTEVLETRQVLAEVYDILKERGYNPNNQLVGYLISGDPGYISSYKDARSKIQTIDRTKIMEVLLENFQRKKK
ncbi:MAG: IreB family regulatory phosphoprotein [Bacilli bacterium]|nr:IreB family regulatory phosphoprotein [Bacilli bacterium]